MAKDYAKSFYKSKAWIQCRKSYIAERVLIDGGMCEECRKEPGYIVHHEITLTQENINNPIVSLNHEHMSYVCKQCHDKYDGHGVGNKKVELLVYFDEHGQPISIRDIDRRSIDEIIF